MGILCYSVVMLGFVCLSKIESNNSRDLDRFVAIKVQKSAKDYQEAAQDEIELLSQLYDQFKIKMEPLENFHVAALLDHFSFRGPNGKHICMVFEVMGNNLLSLIREHDYRGIPLHCVKTIMRDVIQGLDMMHKHKIIHTDLKPENILQRALTQKVRKAISKFICKTVPYSFRNIQKASKMWYTTNRKN
jgi:serine/threonine-protein kinase SRPK3